jgi:tRNA nucleotidyltransferase (CCA-adding enzyme)
MPVKLKNNIYQLPIFAEKIYTLLVENFPHTYLVGGYVRDFLLGKKSSDIDICTTAKPEDIEKVLTNNHIPHNKQHINFGIISIKKSKLTITISTFRKETYTHSRYPTIQYINDLKQDATRRDFTINSLYFSLNSGKILDFFKGQSDLKNQLIRFIGQPKKKIIEDPLRILRAFRFCLHLNFKLEKKTKFAIKKNLNLLNTLSKKIILKEIKKLKTAKHKKILKNIIFNKKMLDKYF